MTSLNLTSKSRFFFSIFFFSLCLLSVPSQIIIFSKDCFYQLSSTYLENGYAKGYLYREWLCNGCYDKHFFHTVFRLLLKNYMKEANMGPTNYGAFLIDRTMIPLYSTDMNGKHFFFSSSVQDFGMKMILMQWFYLAFTSILMLQEC